MRMVPIVVLLAGLALLAHTVESRAADPQSVNRSELPVLVTETRDTVRLQVLLPEDVPPGSVEVQLTGRKVVVLAHGTDGHQRRSRSFRLSDGAASEDGAHADYAPDGSLTITLQKARRRGP